MGRMRKNLSSLSNKKFRSKFMHKVRKRNIKRDSDFIVCDTDSSDKINVGIQDEENKLNNEEAYNIEQTGVLPTITNHYSETDFSSEPNHDNIEISPHTSQLVNVTRKNELHKVQLSSIHDKLTTEYVSEGLQKISLKHNINRIAVSDILKLLNPIMPNLPKDYRTLLATPRVTKKIGISPGEYIHFGIINGIKSIIIKRNVQNQELKLNFFIDGLNVFMTSKAKSFWIILGNIVSIEKSVFPIGIYHGIRKPDKFDEFLEPFVTELRKLIQREANIDNFQISINNFPLDAPARSSVCGTAYHNAYGSCPKCLCQGKHKNGSMLFMEINCEKRTDESFKNRSNPSFHTRNSIIESQLGLNMVSKFPLDMLHVVLLGTVKRMINILLGPKKPMFPHSRNTITQTLENINLTIPSEIHRACRDFKDILTYKGHEFRILLLKTAPVVLKNAIPSEYYYHFMLLTSAFNILCDPDLCIKLNRIADAMLKEFNSLLYDLYGEQIYVPMVHQTVHMADEVIIQQAPCDSFCTWDFESYMTPVKKMIKTPNLPLSQLYKRIFELFNNPFEDENINNNRVGEKFITFQNCRISSEGCRDRFLLTKGKKVIVVQKIMSSGSQFLCRDLIMLGNFFTSPIDSTKLNYFYCKPSYASPKYVINICDIERKLFYMHFQENLFFAPLSKFK